MLQPTLVEKGRFVVVGLSSYGAHADTGDIPALWDHFVPFMATVPNHIHPTVSFGISCYPQDFPSHRQWHYMAAVEVSALDAIPLLMVGKVVPAHLYAVFTHRGPVQNIPATFHAIYHEWLPATPWKVAESFDFEMYGERFTPHDETNSEVDIYIPVAAK